MCSVCMLNIIVTKIKLALQGIEGMMSGMKAMILCVDPQLLARAGPVL